MIDTITNFDSDATKTPSATGAEFRDIRQPAGAEETSVRFPRSATMRALTGRGAMLAMAVVGAAVLATRPGVARRVARAVPMIDLLRRFGLATR